MGDYSHFWRNSECQDATVLLGSDLSRLEQCRAALQAALDPSTYKCDVCKRDIGKSITAEALDHCHPRRLDGDHQRASSAAGCLHSMSRTTRGKISYRELLEIAERAAASMAVVAATCQVLTIPVHRIILSTQSGFFETAISTLVGDRAAAVNGPSSTHPLHLIIAVLVHEDDVVAAQGVLQCLYTETVESIHLTAPRLMQMLLVSSISRSCEGIAAKYLHPTRSLNQNQLATGLLHQNACEENKLNNSKHVLTIYLVAFITTNDPARSSSYLLMDQHVQNIPC